MYPDDYDDNGVFSDGYDDSDVYPDDYDDTDSGLDISEDAKSVNSLDDYTSFMVWGTDFDTDRFF